MLPGELGLNNERCCSCVEGERKGGLRIADQGKPIPTLAPSSLAFSGSLVGSVYIDSAGSPSSPSSSSSSSPAAGEVVLIEAWAIMEATCHIRSTGAEDEEVTCEATLETSRSRVQLRSRA